MIRIFPSDHISDGPNTYPTPGGPQYPDPVFVGGSDETVFQSLDGDGSYALLEWEASTTGAPAIYTFGIPFTTGVSDTEPTSVIFSVAGTDLGSVEFGFVTRPDPHGSYIAGNAVSSPPHYGEQEMPFSTGMDFWTAFAADDLLIAVTFNIFAVGDTARLSYLAVQFGEPDVEPPLTRRPHTRIFPRDDQRGSSPRIYPQPKSQQTPGRITGYQ